MSHGQFYRCIYYISVVLLSKQGQIALRFHQIYLHLCSEDERRSYGFGTTWGWVINDIIFILGWTNPLIWLHRHPKSALCLFSSVFLHVETNTVNTIWYDITPIWGAMEIFWYRTFSSACMCNPCMCGTSLREEELLYEFLPRMRQYCINWYTLMFRTHLKKNDRQRVSWCQISAQSKRF